MNHKLLKYKWVSTEKQMPEKSVSAEIKRQHYERIARGNAMVEIEQEEKSRYIRYYR